MNISPLNNIKNVSFSAVQRRRNIETNSIDEDVFYPKCKKSDLEILNDDMFNHFILADNFNILLRSADKTEFEASGLFSMNALNKCLQVLQDKHKINLKGAKIIGYGAESVAFELNNKKVLKISTSMIPEKVLDILSSYNHPLKENLSPISDIAFISVDDFNSKKDFIAYIQPKYKVGIDVDDAKKLIKKFEDSGLKFFDLPNPRTNEVYIESASKQFGYDKNNKPVLFDYGCLLFDIKRPIASFSNQDYIYYKDFDLTSQLKQHYSRAFEVDDLIKIFNKYGKDDLKIKEQCSDVIFAKELNGDLLCIGKIGNDTITTLLKKRFILDKPSIITYNYINHKYVNKSILNDKMTLFYDNINENALIKLNGLIYKVDTKNKTDLPLIEKIYDKTTKEYKRLDKILDENA